MKKLPPKSHHSQRSQPFAIAREPMAQTGVLVRGAHTAPRNAVFTEIPISGHLSAWRGLA
jgi:hypothetical protein